MDSDGRASTTMTCATPSFVVTLTAVSAEPSSSKSAAGVAPPPQVVMDGWSPGASCQPFHFASSASRVRLDNIFFASAADLSAAGRDVGAGGTAVPEVCATTARAATSVSATPKTVMILILEVVGISVCAGKVVFSGAV